MQSFNELSLSAPLLRAIAELGYEKPSQIQAEALPILLGEPTDFLGLAATGTGKTAAFGLPLLEKINPSLRKVQALILCPTRELALQVSGQINLLGKYKNIRALPVYGGAGYGEQISGLKAGPQVVVGTPGRLVDHLEKGTLRCDELKILVLDEADEMISMGFKEDLETILGSVPQGQANTWLFSATMSREVRNVADQYMTEPQQVQVNKTEMLAENIEQLYFMTSEANKPEILCKVLDATADDFYGLVFCQTKALVADLTQYMAERGYRVDCLHGDMDQNARERTMKSFRDKKVTLLVCTDVASRGLDVKDITHVINYSLPRELDSYVHRIGRTARSGKAGIAMSLVTPSHKALIGRIERMTRSRMKEGRIPTRKEIGGIKVAKMLDKFSAQTTHARAIELMSSEWKDSLASMDSEEVAGRFLALMFPEVFPAMSASPVATSAQQNSGSAKVVKKGLRPTPSAEGRGPRIEARSDDGVASSPRTDGRPSARPTPSASAPRVAPVAMESLELADPAESLEAFEPIKNSEAPVISTLAEALEDVLSDGDVEDQESQTNDEAESAPVAPAAKRAPARESDRPKAADSRESERPARSDARPAVRRELGEFTDQRPERKPYGAKPSGKKSYGEKPAYGAKPYGDKPAYGAKPYGDKPAYGGGKSFGGKPAYGDKPAFGNRAHGDKPAYGAKPYGDKPAYGARPYGDKPSYGGKPAYGGGKSFGDDRAAKPWGARPGLGGGERASYQSGEHRSEPKFGPRPDGRVIVNQGTQSLGANRPERRDYQVRDAAPRDRKPMTGGARPFVDKPLVRSKKSS